MEKVEESASNVEEEVGEVLEQARELQESGASLLWKLPNEEQSLRQRANSLESSIRRLQDLERARCFVTDGEAAAFLPAKYQDVSGTNKCACISKVKEEYNSYRDRTAFLFLLFPLTLLILRSWIWEGCLPAFPVQLYQAWLLFLYTGLALRENILRSNGSDIRPWGVKLFLQWAMMLGVAMLLQNRYQRRRLYTRIALGKAKRMDVVWGETAGVDSQLWVLCPILFLMQGFEAYVGVLLLNTAFFWVVPEWQINFCGLLLVVMAVGNFINTVQNSWPSQGLRQRWKKQRASKSCRGGVCNC
ncbi:hypothetical protein ES288_D12G285500v1 [Gossypium darwinii]|uniref:Transmembrane protein 120 homolog n=1 Tax=Gossypium darwinii TaxID=34276 RepID=A0A5D2AEC3_GOSDA|nr:hypothetical protein ES288_D12G285500v1 [Gossypium darwinii]